MPFFLNPAFLGALALVGVPLIIHLIRKRKLKIVKWAAMEFLRLSQRRQRRRLQIEELILLAIRMLIVALAVLAFARPVLRALGIQILSHNQRVYAVIVVDNSYSMGFRGADGKTSLDRAKASVEDLLGHVLSQGDAVSLVLMSDKPDALIGAPSYDLNLVRRRLAAAGLSDRGTDYLAGSKVISGLLRESKSQIKEVYWLTDDQASAWDSSKSDSARATWAQLAKQARIAWISVGSGSNDRDNLAVDPPIVGRELVTPHLPARLETKIENFGGRSRKDVAVNLVLDGKPGVARHISLEPNSSALVQFTPLLSEPGVHAGRIEIADPQHADGLPVDNGSPFVLRCRDRIRVLIQDMRPVTDPSKSESFYMLTAMAPNGAAESLAPKLKEGHDFGPVNLHDYDAVVITAASALTEPDRALLAEYVRTGGGLLVFPGPDTDSHQLNADLGAAGLLPAKLTARKILGEDNAITIDPSSIAPDQPALNVFRDTNAMNLGSARVTGYYALEPTVDDVNLNAVKVIARFSNRDPAFVERRVGLGDVVLAASSAGSTWNQLPLKPIYVPLIYQLVSYLGQGATSRRNLRQGETLFLSLPLSDANKQVRVTAPNGRTITQNSTLDARGVTFSYSATEQAGIYRVAVADSRTSDQFAVTLPTAESNLAYSDPATSAAAAGVPSDRIFVARTPRDVIASVNRSRYGVEVWRLPIYCVIVLLFIESMLAQLWGRRG